MIVNASLRFYGLLVDPEPKSGNEELSCFGLLGTPIVLQLIASYGKEHLDGYQSSDYYQDVLRGRKSIPIAWRKVINPLKTVEFVYALFEALCRRAVLGVFALIAIAFIQFIHFFAWCADKFKALVDKHDDADYNQTWLILEKISRFFQYFLTILLLVVEAACFIAYIPILVTFLTLKACVNFCTSFPNFMRFWMNSNMHNNYWPTLILAAFSALSAYVVVTALPPVVLAFLGNALVGPLSVISPALIPYALGGLITLLAGHVLSDFCQQYLSLISFFEDFIMAGGQVQATVFESSVYREFPHLDVDYEEHVVFSPKEYAIFNKSKAISHGQWSAFFFNARPGFKDDKEEGAAYAAAASNHTT